MMNLIDYATDVGLDVEKIKSLCDKIGISYENEESLLTVIENISSSEKPRYLSERICCSFTRSESE